MNIVENMRLTAMYYILPLNPRTNHSLLFSMLRYRHMTLITLLNHQYQQLRFTI